MCYNEKMIALLSHLERYSRGGYSCLSATESAAGLYDSTIVECRLNDLLKPRGSREPLRQLELRLGQKLRSSGSTGSDPASACTAACGITPA